MQIFVLNRVRVLGSGPHTPTKLFQECPLEAILISLPRLDLRIRNDAVYLYTV